MPIILATQKAEIRRIMVLSQHGQVVCKTLSQKNSSQKGLSSNPSISKKKKDKTYIIVNI
jgi:hypothetical protein